MKIFENSFSENTISFVKINQKYYIKKKNKFFDRREIDSINKQNKFKSFFLDDYKVASAKITFDLNKNRSFYLVDFYPGKSGADILLTGNIDEIKILSKFFLNNYFNLNNKISYEKISKYIFIEKIENIKKKIENKKFIFFKNEIILKVKNIFSKDIYYPKNKLCHGDLTLSNMIINSTKKYIILFDFQKTYNDNLIQDYSKIYQDIVLNWTARKFSQNNKTRAAIVYDNLIPKLNWDRIDPTLFKTIKQEVCMTLLRILPYINPGDLITLKWIENSFNKIIK
jgi:hypothetical protein